LTDALVHPESYVEARRTSFRYEASMESKML
jgi:hypothetical protein